jgi:hypothetical protein
MHVFFPARRVQPDVIFVSIVDFRTLILVLSLFIDSELPIYVMCLTMIR